MTDTQIERPQPAPDGKSDDSTLYLGAGLGLGAYATATTIFLGAACPVCVVAAPSLIGVGLYQKWKKARRAPSASR